MANEIPNGQRVSRMISLDELAEMTRKQQEMPSKDNMVQTTDLTSNKSMVDPRKSAMVDRMLDDSPIITPTSEGYTERYNPRNNPAASTAVPPMSQPNTVRQAPPQNRKPNYAPSKSMKPVNISEVVPHAEKKVVGKEFREKLFGDLDKAIERDKQQMWNDVVEPLYEKKLEEHMEEQEGFDSDDELPSPHIPTQPQEEEAVDQESMLYDDRETESLAPVSAYVPNNTERVSNDDLFNDEDSEEESMTEQDNGTKFINPSEKAAEFVRPNEVEDEEYEAPITVEPESDDDDNDLVEEVDEETESEPMDVYEEKEEEEEEPSLIPQSKEISEDIKTIDLDKLFENTDDDDDPEDTTEVELSEEEQQEEVEAIKKVIKKQANPISDVINLADFTVSSKATTTSKVLSEMTQSKKSYSANWVYITAGRPFTMREFSGSEIDKLNPSAETGLEELQRMRELYGIFYDHITDANKPESFEAWAKTVPFNDIDQLYFGAYRASFSHGSNLLPYTCTNKNCKHSFMEHHTVNSMIKFKDDEAKAKIKDMLAKDPTGEELNIKSKIFQVSDTICISFKTPSLYNVIFEAAALPQKFRDKYRDLVYYINCIEKIYRIDRVNKKLIPMQPKVETNNIVKTVNNKYKAYASVLQMLSSDQYYSIPSFIKEVTGDMTSDLVSFAIPETTCPKCGKKVAEQKMTAMEALFTRHHLQTILVI